MFTFICLGLGCEPVVLKKLLPIWVGECTRPNKTNFHLVTVQYVKCCPPKCHLIGVIHQNDENDDFCCSGRRIPGICILTMTSTVQIWSHFHLNSADGHFICLKKAPHIPLSLARCQVYRCFYDSIYLCSPSPAPSPDGRNIIRYSVWKCDQLERWTDGDTASEIFDSIPLSIPPSLHPSNPVTCFWSVFPYWNSQGCHRWVRVLHADMPSEGRVRPLFFRNAFSNWQRSFVLFLCCVPSSIWATLYMMPCGWWELSLPPTEGEEGNMVGNLDQIHCRELLYKQNSK